MNEFLKDTNRKFPKGIIDRLPNNFHEVGGT